MSARVARPASSTTPPDRKDENGRTLVESIVIGYYLDGIVGAVASVGDPQDSGAVALVPWIVARDRRQLQAAASVRGRPAH